MSGCHTLDFDWPPGVSASGAVIDAVAEFRGQDPTEIEPLYSAVDPDALNAISSRTRGAGSSEVTVEFTYAGLRVRVHANGEGQIVEES